MLRRLYWRIRIRLFDNREAHYWECPLCHWDSCNDDECLNATMESRRSYPNGLDTWNLCWSCPRCGTRFITNESN